MIVRAPEPPLVIPEIPLTPFLLERAADRGDKPAYHRRDDRADAHLSAMGRRGTERRGRPGRTRTAQGRRRRHLQPEPARVLGRVSRGLAHRRRDHHDQSALHPGELGAQLNDAGAQVSRHGAAVRSTKAAAGRARVGRARDLRLRRGRRRDAVCLAARARGRSSGRRDRSAGRPGRASLFQRHDRTPQGRDAHALQPRREPPAGRLRAARATTPTRCSGVLPFFHIYGMVVIMNLGLHRGATVVTMPRFEIEQFLHVLQTLRRDLRSTSCRRSCSRWRSTRLVDKYTLTSLRVSSRAPRRCVRTWPTQPAPDSAAGSSRGTG